MSAKKCSACLDGDIVVIVVYRVSDDRQASYFRGHIAVVQRQGSEAVRQRFEDLSGAGLRDEAELRRLRSGVHSIWRVRVTTFCRGYWKNENERVPSGDCGTRDLLIHWQKGRLWHQLKDH